MTTAERNTHSAETTSAELKQDVQSVARAVAAALAAGGGLSKICRMNADELGVIQAQLQHGSTVGIWGTPPQWLRTNSRTLSSLRVDLRTRIEHFLSQEARTRPDLQALLDEAVLGATRLLLLLRMRGVGGLAKPLGGSTAKQYAYSHLPAVYAAAIKRAPHCRAEGGDKLGFRLLGNLSSADARLALPSGSTYTNVINSLVKRLDAWSKKEPALWLDNFKPAENRGAGSGLDAVAQGEAPLNDPVAQHKEYQPLPDDFAGPLAYRCLFLSREVAHNLIDLAPLIVHVYKAGYGEAKKMRTVKKILADHRWTDSRGEDISLPFELSYGGKKASSVGGLPVTLEGYRQLLSLVQTAHIYLTGLNMGARGGEVTELKTSCVKEKVEHGGTQDDPRQYRAWVLGHDFKGSERQDGTPREWPIAPQVASVLKTQESLRKVALEIRQAVDPQFNKKAVEYLWVVFNGKPNRSRLSDEEGSGAETLDVENDDGAVDAETVRVGSTGEQLVQLNDALRGLAKAFGLPTNPGGTPLTSHRLRKTLARLVALAFVESPLILMEIFGHNNVEMTLHYILANREIRAEIETVARELVVMRASESVQSMVDAELDALKHTASRLDVGLGDDIGEGLYSLADPIPSPQAGFGGKAAEKVNNFVAGEVLKRHDTGQAWGVDDTYELSSLLTNNGKTWMLIGEGRICTKTLGAVGPCSANSRGAPDPAKCSSGCDHRLVDPGVRARTKEVLDFLLRLHKRCIDEGDEMQAVYVVGQFKENLEAFSDVKADYLARPDVQAMLGAQPVST